jgi:hypothetical protein
LLYHRRVTRVGWRETLFVALLPLVLYVSYGTLGAYLARDDFQWLNDARDLGVMRSIVVTGRAHFYRPVVELWWDGAFRVCGTSTVCYHSLELLLHVINGVLLLHLTARVFGRRDVALIAAGTWVVMPSYVEAVIWVCAVTTAFATVWYLAALHFALTAAGRERAGWASWASVACAAAAMYSHEATVTLFATIPLVVWVSPHAVRKRPRAPEVAAFGLLAVSLAVTTIVANRRSYVFTERHYVAGRHALQHARDYVLSMYVGRHATWDYIALAVAAVAIAFRGTRVVRTGLAWMVLTMPPYLWFTWGNVGRYTYLPAMGLCWILAGAIAWIRDRVEARAGLRIAVATATLLAILVAGRFASFTRNAIRGQVTWMEAYRTYRDQVTPLLQPQAAQVRVPSPRDPRVEPEYVEPMLQWTTGSRDLKVHFIDR